MRMVQEDVQTLFNRPRRAGYCYTSDFSVFLHELLG